MPHKMKLKVLNGDQKPRPKPNRKTSTTPGQPLSHRVRSRARSRSQKKCLQFVSVQIKCEISQLLPRLNASQTVKQSVSQPVTRWLSQAAGVVYRINARPGIKCCRK